MRRIAAGLVCFVLGEGLVHAQPPSAPSVSVEEFTGRTADPFIPKSLPELLENEMGRPLNACGGHIIEWRRRADIEREVDLARKGLIDPATAPREGRNMRPDVFVRGTVNGDSSYTWKIQLVAAVGGEILGEDSGTVPAQDLFEAVPQVATRLVRKLCEQRVGYAMDGVMDEATITGTICGTLDKPFTAVSPEVGGSWTFTPTSAAGGTFSYTATNIGGVPGSGKGTYTLIRTASGGERIQLAGSGSIKSPVGEFSAPITEHIDLTPVKTCGRVGNK